MTRPAVAALTAVSALAALSFARIFEEPSSALPAVAAAMAAHLVVAVGVGRSWPPLATASAVAAGVGLVCAWAVAPETTAAGVPTTATLAELVTRFERGLEEISTTSAPLAPDSGIVLVTALGMGLAAAVAHSIASHARGVLSALVPAVSIYAITGGVGDERFRAPLAVALVGAALLFVLAHAPARASTAHAWFSVAGRRGGVRAGFAVGIPVVVLAALAAPLLGPRLPEARSEGALDWSGGGGGRTRVTVSPLVDIRGRLTRDPPVEVFRVEAGRPQYWRMAALETYDGEIWSSLADYSSADGTLPADSREAPTAELLQRYEITGLAQFWLPAAYRPVSIDHPSARVNPDSLTLLTEEETAAGLRYEVRSAVPAYTADDFARETGRVPEELRPMLEVPGVSPTVAQIARDVTEGEPGVYGKAIALQTYFREQFTYSEEVPAGHSGDQMVDFLTEGRTGYCEQFASSFAVMARTLGIPARVAVGFTPGRRAPDGSFVVTSDNAHAWPEVYIDPFGWVAFEPTPLRFHPSPANHTGTFDAGAQPEPDEQAATSTTATTAPPSAAPPETTPPEAADREPGIGGGEGSPWPRRVALLLAAAALTLVGAAVARFHLREAARRRRWSRSGPRDVVLLTWSEVLEHLRAHGLTLRSSLTPAEVSGEVTALDTRLSAPIEELREVVELAAYAPVEPGPADVARARSAGDAVRELLDHVEPAGQRIRRRLHLPA